MEIEEIKETLLGLDVSTKTVGVTLAVIDKDDNVKVLQVTHLRPKVSSKIKGTESLFAKSNIIGKELERYKNYNIDKVIIEEPLVGSNNAETVAVLLRYNGMISQLVYYTLGIVPEFISSYDARKYGFPQLMAVRKFNKKGETYDLKKIRKSIKKNELVLFGQYSFDCAKKLILWNIVSDMFPDIEWQYNKKGELKDENFDASDSLVCILGYIGKRKYGDMQPKILNAQETRRPDGSVLIEYQTSFCGQTYSKTLELSSEEVGDN